MAYKLEARELSNKCEWRVLESVGEPDPIYKKYRWIVIGYGEVDQLEEASTAARNFLKEREQRITDEAVPWTEI